MIGFLGSLHCVGMCGPLVLACSMLPGRSGAIPDDRWKNFLRQAIFHGGRLLTYGVLGAAAAGFFRTLELTRLLFHIRPNMTLTGGILLVLFGLALLRLVPVPSFLFAASTGLFSRLGVHPSELIRSERMGSRLLLGLLTGLMPCCLSWAMIVNAAATRNPLEGFLSMAAFGCGTIPALFAVGISASFLPPRMRLLGERAAALSVVVLGIVLIAGGMGIIDLHH